MEAAMRCKSAAVISNDSWTSDFVTGISRCGAGNLSQLEARTSQNSPDINRTARLMPILAVLHLRKRFLRSIGLALTGHQVALSLARRRRECSAAAWDRIDLGCVRYGSARSGHRVAA